MGGQGRYEFIFLNPLHMGETYYQLPNSKTVNLPKILVLLRRFYPYCKILNCDPMHLSGQELLSKTLLNLHINGQKNAQKLKCRQNFANKSIKM